MRPLDFLNTLPKKIRAKFEGDPSIYVNNDEIRWDGRGLHAQQAEIGMPMTVTPAYREEKADFVRQLDVYRRKIVEVRVLRQKLTGKVYKIVDKDYEYAPDEKLLLQKKITDLQLQQIGIPPQEREIYLLEEVEVPVWRVEYYQQISGKAYVPDSDETLPISNYPIVPVVGDDTGNAMPLAEVDQMVGEQEILNAAIGLTLLNAALSSNWRVLVDAGKAGLDPNKLAEFQRTFSIPGSWHNIKSDPATGKFPIEIMRPDPLPVAWFSLVQYFAQAMEFQLSTYSLRTGDPSKAPETLGATLQLGQWANELLRIPLGRLEIAIERLFNCLLEWMPYYYTTQKGFEIVGVDGNPVRREINVPVYSEVEQAWKTMYSLKDIQANYRIRLGSTTPSQATYELGVMERLAQLRPELVINVIDRLPGLRESEKQEIKQSLDTVMQLSQQNSQQAQVITTLQTQLQRLQESVVALQREKAIAQVEPAIATFVADMKHMRSNLEEKVRSKNGKVKS
jgi:hypothetical protein